MIDFCFLDISSVSKTWKVCYEHPLVASWWLLISLSSTCILLRVKKSHCIDFTVVVSITIFLESLLINFLLKCRVSIIIHFLDASFDFIYKICFCWFLNALSNTTEVYLQRRRIEEQEINLLYRILIVVLSWCIVN